MKATLNGNKLVLEIDIEPGQVSKSGKSKIVCGTSGFEKTGLTIDGKELKISVNGIIPV